MCGSWGVPRHRMEQVTHAAKAEGSEARAIQLQVKEL